MGVGERTVQNGLAWAVWLLVLSLAVFSIFWGVLDLPVDMLFQTGADTATGADAAQGREYARLAWDWLPLFALLIGAVGFASRAVWESKTT